VTLTTPVGSSVVTATIALGANASDDVGVVAVQFAVDGVNLGSAVTVTPYTTGWNSTTVPNGAHVVTATARDAAGNQQSASVSVTVANDTTPPTVAVTSPVESAVVAGTIALGASATDDVGVVGVQFALDGVNLGVENTVAPYQRTWNSVTVPNGVHVLMATARDAAGNQRSHAVTVSVANDTTAPTIAMTGPSDGATVSGTVAFAADASDDVAVAGVQFMLDGVNLGADKTVAPYELAWDTATVPNGAHVLTATARDAAGNQQSASVTLSVTNDTTAPTVTVIGPSDGATVSDTVSIAADASDDVAVVGVQFTLDGVNLGAELTIGPYELAWDTTTVPDGMHVLTAIARDAAGNQQMAASASVTVSNSLLPQP
jgi:hypothetical protein